MTRFLSLVAMIAAFWAASAAAQEPVRWKAVLVAGDDSVPVFENAVTALSERFRERGVAEIRVLSASPRASRSEAPATSRNLLRALDSLKIGAGDGCLLYFTSHGTEAGLLMSRDPESRALLTPDAMEKAVDTYCAGLPTVVVVSACHAGTFLRDGIVDDSRIVLVAARKERVSFGCDFRLRYNYFDGCLLGELDRSVTWRELFERTRACIDALEGGQVSEKSEPQAFFGERVKDMPLPAPRAGQ